MKASLVHESAAISEPASSSLFRAWRDPASGVESFILDRRVAPFQQSFYFTSPSFSNDGRYYWFYCAFPPGVVHQYGKSLAVVDFAAGTVRHFPETTFGCASPMVDLETGEVYWNTGLEIWKRRPEPNAKPVLVNRLPKELVGGRHVEVVVTHMTFSADRKAVNIDAQIGRAWYIGHAPLDGSNVVIWCEPQRPYHHCQFSPTDIDLQLIPQNEFTDPATGEYRRLEQRLWLLRRGGEPEPLYPGGGSDMQGHEWWSRDGRRVWYCHYHHGVEYIDIHERKPVLVYPFKTGSHAHVDAAERYVAIDFLPPEDPTDRRVVFFNRQTGREVPIVSSLPEPPPGLANYHVHPHPQFCCNDRYVCYTTTVLGQVDVAFTPVEALVDATC